MNGVLITADDTITKTDYYTTLEEQQIFAKAFPEMVALFQQVTQGKQKQGRQKKGLVFVLITMNSFSFCSCVSLVYLLHMLMKCRRDAEMVNM